MKPLLLGHRGARSRREIPENTLESFELCLQHGCDGFEFDVRASADGRLVVCHDEMSRGMEVARTSAHDLGLPTLDEVSHRFGGRAFLDIELKVAGVEVQTLAVLREAPPQRGYVVSSFLPEALAAVHRMDRAVPLGMLCETGEQLRGWRQAPGEWVAPHRELVSRELVDQIHANGKKVVVWTVNDVECMKRLVEWGVEGIISDETELLAQL